MSLQSLNDYCAKKNSSGVLTFEYVPTAWIDPSAYERIVSSTNNWQFNIPFTQGGWLTAGVIAEPRKKLWRENQRPTPQGPTYNQTVSGITPKVQPSITGEFAKMAHYRYLLRVTDKNDQVWILGTIDEPFEFSAASTTGNNGGPNQYDIQFTSTTSKRAHGFVPIN